MRGGASEIHTQTQWLIGKPQTDIHLIDPNTGKGYATIYFGKGVCEDAHCTEVGKDKSLSWYLWWFAGPSEILP